MRDVPAGGWERASYEIALDHMIRRLLVSPVVARSMPYRAATLREFWSVIDVDLVVPAGWTLRGTLRAELAARGLWFSDDSAAAFVRIENLDALLPWARVAGATPFHLERLEVLWTARCLERTG